MNMKLFPILVISNKIYNRNTIQVKILYSNLPAWNIIFYSRNNACSYFLSDPINWYFVGFFLFFFILKLLFNIVIALPFPPFIYSIIIKPKNHPTYFIIFIFQNGFKFSKDFYIFIFLILNILFSELIRFFSEIIYSTISQCIDYLMIILYYKFNKVLIKFQIYDILKCKIRSKETFYLVSKKWNNPASIA